MSTQKYYVECHEVGYCVVDGRGTLATFSRVDEAFSAMRDFQSKSFPEDWQKVPPAMRHSQEMYYGHVL